MKVALFVVIGLAIGINIFAFIAEKVMKKKINKIANDRKNE